MSHRPTTTDPVDLALIERTRQERDALDGPRVGDFVQMLDGTRRRFSERWPGGMQTTCAGKLEADQSFFLSGSFADFSGSLDAVIPFGQLELTGEACEGRFWMFHHNEVRAHNGVSFTLPCRLFRQLEAASLPSSAPASR